jgi:hypothetical protein
MENRRPVGDPYEAAGNDLFGDGWRFRLNITPAQDGSLYLLNEDVGPDNKTRYNVLFPTVENNGGVSQISAKQRMETGWYYFVNKPGVEKLWVIWAAQALPDLETIFREARVSGEIAEPSKISKLQTYLKQSESQAPDVVSEKSQKRTVITGKGDMFVALVELSHLQR